MKPFAVALALIFAGSLFGASAAQAATPKEGRWTVKIDGSPVPSGPTGAFGVAKKGKKLVVTALYTPRHNIKCIGERARPMEINPGYPHSWGGGEEPKISKKGKFSYSRSFKSGSITSRYSLSGRFTSSGKASGVLRSRFTGDPKRTCDSGELKWKASKK